MRILAALRARTMAGTASTPRVATPPAHRWGRGGGGAGGGVGLGPPAWGGPGGGVGGGGGGLWTGRRRRAWVFLWGVAKSCGSGGLARRQISAPAAVSGDVLRGLQRV